MKKYAIGLCSFEEDIEVVIVEANDASVAMCIAVNNKYGWDVIAEEQGMLPFTTLDEAVDYFLQGDINISKPVEV